MELTNDIETGVALVLIIWSIALGWARWQIHIMRRELERERLGQRRWNRLKAVWEAQQRGRWQ
jgi:hypothetical protein